MADLALNITATTDGARSNVEALSQAIRELSSSVKRSTAEVGKMGGETRAASVSMKRLGGSVKGATGAFSKFTKSIGRIAFYRSIRTAIRYVTDSFKKGLEAAYAFSKANQPADYAKLAGAMDGIKKAASTMSLQLGAAFGGLITAIAPVLIKIINLVTQAADAITRFFAALAGSGYYKHAAEGFDDVGDSAGGAGKKIKGLLASWDELNVIGKETGGGGGGSNTPDYSGAYEWVEPESDWANLFASGDFFGIGAKIGDALGNISQKITNFLTNPAIQNFGKNLADALNGSVSKPENWESFGEAIGTAIGTFTRWVVEFIDNVDWPTVKEALKRLAKGIKDGFDEEMDGVFESDDSGQNISFAQWLHDKIDPGPIIQDGENGLIWKMRRFLADVIEVFLKWDDIVFDIGNGLEQIGLKFKIWWQKVVIWLNEKDLEWNEGLAKFYLGLEKVKVPLQMVFNDIKQIAIKGWKDFLELLNDSNAASFLAKIFGVDLPGAIEKANKAMTDAKIEAWYLDQEYTALQNGTYDLSQKYPELTGKIDANKAAIEDAKEKSAKYQEQLDTLQNGIDVTTTATQAATAATGDLVKTVNEIDGTRTAILDTEFDENGEKVLQTVVQEISDYDKIDATADLGFDVPTEDQKRLQDAWNSVSAYGKASGTASLGYGYAAGALNTLNGAKTNLSEYGKISANATIGINGDKAVTEALPTIKEAFNAVKDKTGKLTISQDKKNPKPKDLDKMATAYDKFKDNSTKNGAVNLTSKGDLLSKVGNALFLTVITTAWNALSAGTKKLTVQLDSGKTDIASFVAGWNKLSDKTVRFSISVDEEMKSKWNYLGKKWNNSPLATAYGRLPLFAQGGFPEKGQLFIANEAGPELVSTMGGQTAVANNDQIISGIQRGTEQANEEQNELLRQQNSILMRLLNKEFTLSPSVALGQVMARSAALYGRA